MIELEINKLIEKAIGSALVSHIKKCKNCYVLCATVLKHAMEEKLESGIYD